MSDTPTGHLGSLLLPLFVLALLLPVAVRNPVSGDSADKTTVTPFKANARRSGRAAEFLCRHLGTKPDCSLNPSDVGALIVTVPDPVASQLNYTFDRYIDAILRATESVNYRLDSFDLPWLDDNATEAMLTVKYALDRLELGSDQGEAQKNPGEQEPRPNRFEREAGIVLLRNTSPKALPPQPLLLVILLVGETPTGGVHRVAFRDALNQFAELSKWKPQRGLEDSEACDGRRGDPERTVRVLGPSFSGSADSLKRAIQPWLCEFDDLHRPSVTMVSGSATAIDADALQSVLGRAGAFNSTVRPTADGLNQFLSTYVGSGEPQENDGGGLTQFLAGLFTARSRTRKVALLSEGNTGFGAVGGQFRSKEIAGLQVIPLTFPLHISRLRAASEKIASGRTSQASVPDLRQRNLPIPVDASSERSVIPATSELEAPSAELVLAHILRTISQEQVRYVGIIATDIRDKLFLAREVRSHCPNVTLFTDVPDLLYVHSDANSDMRGALTLSTYPLFGRNQVWTAAPGRVQFPTSGAQGVYNAALALLNRPDLMLEYIEPFGGPAAFEARDRLLRPPLWLSVVGRHELWPVRLLADSTGASMATARYLWPPGNSVTRTQQSVIPTGTIRSKPADDQWVRDLMPEASRMALFIVMLCCVAPSIVFIRLIPLRRLIAPSDTRGTNGDRRHSSGPHGTSYAFHKLEALDRLRQFCESAPYHPSFEAASLQPGDALKTSREPIAVDRWVYLLTLTAALLSISLLVWGVTALPVRALTLFGVSIRQQLRTFGIFALASSALLIVLAGMVSVILAPLLMRTEWRSDITWRAVRERGALPLTISAASVGTALLLVGSWMLVARGSRGLAEAIFLYARAVDLASGVSPLTPLILVGIAGVLSVMCSIRRLAGVEYVVGPGVFLDVDSSSFAGVRTLEGRLRHQITCSSIELPLSKEACLGLLVILGFATYRLYSLSTLSFEVPAFDWAFRTMFAAVYLALLIIFLRFLFIWRDLRQLLRALAGHPIAAWFAELRKAQPGASDATPMSTSRFCQSTELSVTLATRTARAAHRVRLADVDETAARLHQLVASMPGKVVLRSEELHQHAERAERSLSLALSAEAEHQWTTAVENRRAADDALARLTATVAHILEPHWRLNADEVSNAESASTDVPRIFETAGVGRQPATTAHDTTPVMSLTASSTESGRGAMSGSEPVTNPQVSGSGVTAALVGFSELDGTEGSLLGSSLRRSIAVERNSPEAAEMLRDMGGRFLAARVLSVAYSAVWHMKNLLLFLTAALLVMLLAVTSYPIQPRDLLLTFNWTVILTFVAATMMVFVQMEKDSVLSALSGTVSGRVTWNREFAIRVLLFGVLPILSMLGAQFPDAIGRSMPWLNSVLSDMH